MPGVLPEWMKEIFAGRDKIEGVESIENMIVIDQTPIGRSSRSTPATYLGFFDEIRAIFASLPESNIRGYKVGRFSFNVAEGRCSNCAGEGYSYRFYALFSRCNYDLFSMQGIPL